MLYIKYNNINEICSDDDKSQQRQMYRKMRAVIVQS